MFKKIMIASAIFSLCSGMVFAESAPYVGVNMGLNVGSMQLKNYTGNSTKFNSTGALAGVFAGYGATLANNFYLGGEFFINDSSVKTSTKTTAPGITNSLSASYSYGVNLLPGVQLTESTRVYAKLGVVRTRFELNQDPVVPSLSILHSDGNVVTGGQIGAGVQGHVSSHFDVRGEYLYTNYRTFTTFNNQVTPKNNQVNLGLIYNF